MNNTTKKLFVAGISVFAFSLSAQAATIANWAVFGGTPSTSGMTTDSPTIGDGSPNNADGVTFAGKFGTVATPESVTLSIGETLTVSGSVIFTGGTNVVDNFRFGVFQDTAFADSTFESGGWLAEAGNSIFQGRTNGNFASTSSNASTLTSTVATTNSFDGDSTAAYDWSFSITRDSATTVDLFASLNGGDNSYNYSATSNDVTTGLFTYNVVGILLGGNLDADQASFSSVSYTAPVPEPSSAALLGLGGLALILRRRK